MESSRRESLKLAAAGMSQAQTQKPAATMPTMAAVPWRTHSCVQRSHFPETLVLCGAANLGCSRLSAGSLRLAKPQETSLPVIVCHSCEREM